MKARWVVGLVAGGVAVVLAVGGPAGGCGSDSCVKDTDCELPLVCVRSACVPPGGGGDTAPVDDGGPGDEGEVEGSDGDGEIVEGGEIADEGDGDAELLEDGSPEESEGGEDGGACVPAISAPLAIAPAAAGADERPLGLADGGEFVAFFRIPSTLAPPQGLRFQRFRLDGAVASSALWSQGAADLSALHPIIGLPGGGFAAVMHVVTGGSPGIWVKILGATGTGASAQQIPNTDANSREPTLTFDGTRLVVAWAQASTAGDTVEIRALHVDAATGTTSDSYATLASGPTGTGEPRLAWGSGGLTLAYFDAGDGALHVKDFDGLFAEHSNAVLSPPATHSFVGSPALVWNGSEFGLLWETRGAGSSTMHLAVFAEGETPIDHEPLTDVALSSAEQGQVALAWGGAENEWGIAWRHSQAARVGISVATVDAVAFTLKDGPTDIRPDTVAAAHPSLAYNSGFYMVLWVEDPGTTEYPIYEATWGCAP
ncbi:MAG: hypothetical protein HY907_09675 [Deltaproteobacteria bacterium]|nr:hypothetical protein [Deltaproteobacteria bacterium]